ncbi:DUF222 domain-containing protein [Aeromicrobium sp.]|uniref:HNH endonuclease n=1 Tax=Aeromicrobium sp. TaxID=1871063 RepID=UPI0028ABF95F|nr:DUF222 domain-containing protein [Aeromicrobium sp.]
MSSGVDELIAVLRTGAQALRSVTSSTADELRALAAIRDAAEAAMSDRLADLEKTQEHVAEDAPSVRTWARRELRQSGTVTGQMLRAAHTMRELPQVGESARAGRISLEHVQLFTFALAHVDNDAVRRIETELVTVAERHVPHRVKELVDRLRAVLHTEELDRAWIAGQDKAHLSVNALPDGWHVTGFLPTEVGAKLKAVLASVAVPREAGDRRSASERRIDGLDNLLTRVLADGLPTDGTVRPQVHVVVDAGTLQRALAPTTDSAFEPAEPATLVGFGPIGPNLLAHLTCGADLTPILVDRIAPHAEVLDVGRTHRDATARQRHALWIRQRGACATEHCAHPIDHAHHDRRWSDGGPTDLRNLIGLCAACHRHEHRREHQREREPLARAG